MTIIAMSPHNEHPVPSRERTVLPVPAIELLSNPRQNTTAQTAKIHSSIGSALILSMAESPAAALAAAPFFFFFFFLGLGGSSSITGSASIGSCMSGRGGAARTLSGISGGGGCRLFSKLFVGFSGPPTIDSSLPPPSPPPPT